jgi:hypothetical protein
MNRTPAFALLGVLALAAVTSSASAYPTREGHPVQYVIITSDALAPSFAPLADWKTQTGVPAIVRPLSAVLADHPVAFDDAERVRLEIRAAWAAGAKWVLLGGDGSVVPRRYARTSFYGGNDILTDLYFQCLDGDWDANGNHIYGEAAFGIPSDNADLVPEVWLGRAPVNTLAEAALFVQKTIQVQRTPAGDYEHRSLECAEVLFPDNWNPGDSDPSFDGSDIVEPLLPYFDLHPSLAVTRLYERLTNPGLRPGALAETKAAVLAQMNAGTNQTLVVGVGDIHRVRTGDASITEADLAGLTNGTRLMNLWLMDCSSAWFDSGGTGRAALLAPGGGAVSVIGATHFEFPVAERSYSQEFYRLVYVDGVNTLGETLGRCRAPFIPFSATDQVNRWVQMTLQLLGDPELRMATGVLRTLQVTHAPVVVIDDAILAVDVAIAGTPLAGARVAAWRGGEFLGVATTNGAGHADVPIDPQTIGSFVLTVTAYDAKPYEAQVQVVTPPTPTLISFISADARFDRVSLVAFASGPWGARVTIERARDGDAWREVAQVTSDATGRMHWDDTEVEAGATYRYRVGVMDGNDMVYAPSIEVMVPARPLLALRIHGAQPVSGPIAAELTLPDASSARLQLVDAHGRRIAEREVGSLGPGRHLLTMSDARSLAPGVYWIRLTHGGQFRTARAVVLR